MLDGRTRDGSLLDRGYPNNTSPKTHGIDINSLIILGSPKECLNFQGFPKDFNFPEFMPDSQCYKQAGNSVVVPVVERIAKEILNALDLKINPINNNIIMIGNAQFHKGISEYMCRILKPKCTRCHFC